MLVNSLDKKILTDISRCALALSFRMYLSGCLVIVSAIILLTFVLVPPYWGLADDANIIALLVPTIQQEGWIHGIGSLLREDLRWGMFRVTYIFDAYFLYMPGIVF